MQKLTLIGNLVKDAEVKNAEGRLAINFSVAINERIKNNGETQEITTYYNCVIWRESNVEVAKYLTKGTGVYLEGTPKPEVYNKKNGDTVGAIKMVVKEIKFLSKGSGKTNNTNAQTGNVNNPNNTGDDLPF